MLFPEVVQTLKRLADEQRRLAREIAYLHGQFQQALKHVPQLRSLIDMASQASEGAAATLVAAGDKIEEVEDGSQDPTLF